MKTKQGRRISLFVLLCVMFQSHFAFGLMIDEEWYAGHTMVKFTVIAEESDGDVHEIAVGNNDATYAHPPSDILWKSAVLVNQGTPDSPKWVFEDGSGYSIFDPASSEWHDYDSIYWLDEDPEFNEYERAFYYYSGAFGVPGKYPPLEPGQTYLFFGDSGALASPFAALNIDGNIITGHTNIVPLPNTFVLLVSALGVFNWHRRLKMASKNKT